MSRIPKLAALLLFSCAMGQEQNTLPPLADGVAPTDFGQMWAGFDPLAEPLEIETLREWEEDGVVLRIIRLRIGVFKGQKAKLAAIYGFPKGAESNRKLPGLVQIHGGGQYADHRACLMNAKRGYATVSIAWAGRISAPEYRVSPAEVKLFWDNKTEDPSYKLTTDWGAVDGYHAPGRNPKNNFPSANAAAWTIDTIESPRNSPWFLCAIAARRALTFLEQQPEVNPDKLGVYGHSMGGKLTVMTSVDSRVKAAAPSCGGISDRENASKLFETTICDHVSLKQVKCPIMFLSPANDFHGRISDLRRAVDEIQTDDWRITCAPHHNHQDTAAYEVATLLWFDQHLKGSFKFPKTPQTALRLQNSGGTPVFTIQPDTSRPIRSINVFYTQHGKAVETRFDRENTMSRFWRHADVQKTGETWTASLPVSNLDQPLWAYANVNYVLDAPVSGAGYYYGLYSTSEFNVSSLMDTVSPEQLRSAGVKPSLTPNSMIETFAAGWQKEWFTYKPDNWPRTTHKLYDAQYAAPKNAILAIQVRCEQPNKLVILIDRYAAVVDIEGAGQWQDISLSLADFKDHGGDSLESWESVRRLTLSDAERLQPAKRDGSKARIVGKNWQGSKPDFRNLRWVTASENE